MRPERGKSHLPLLMVPLVHHFFRDGEAGAQGCHDPHGVFHRSISCRAGTGSGQRGQLGFGNRGGRVGDFLEKDQLQSSGREAGGRELEPRPPTIIRMQ